jgi:hypothetical protein
VGNLRNYFLPATSEICVWHENARLPSMCTMQAPHRPAPQPNLVPVSYKSSRITHSSGVSGGASVVAALPFTRKLVVIASSLDPSAPKAVTGLANHPANKQEWQWLTVRSESRR